MEACKNNDIFNCCHKAHISCLKKYLDNGGDPNAIKNGHSLLERSIYSFSQNDHALLNQGIYSFSQNYQDTDECIHILVQNGADINLKLNTRRGETAFHHAVARYSRENVQFLLENGADINSSEDAIWFAVVGCNAYSQNMAFIKNWEESFSIKEPVSV
jgi:hypothetical protein